MESKEWTAPPDEELRIPAEYLTGLVYEVIVLSAKKLFTFKCGSYELSGQLSTFHRVIMDTSKRNARGDVTLQRVSYHEQITLGNTGFMLIPIPDEVSPQPAD